MINLPTTLLLVSFGLIFSFISNSCSDTQDSKQKLMKVRVYTADEIYQQKIYYIRNKIVVAEYELDRLLNEQKYGAKPMSPLEQIELSRKFQAQTDQSHLPADFQEYTKRCNALSDSLEDKIKQLPNRQETASSSFPSLSEFYFEHFEPLREEFLDAALFFEGSSEISKALEEQLSDEVVKLCRQDPQPNLSRIESDIIEAKYTLRVLQSLLKDIEQNQKPK